MLNIPVLKRFPQLPGSHQMMPLLQAAGIPVLAVLPPSQSTRAQRLIGGTGPTVTPPSLRLGN